MTQGPIGQGSSAVKAGMVTYSSNGGSVDGYLARPSDGRAHPGVILIQEWWGIEPHIKELTERVAAQGYTVLAPDLYHGKVAKEPDEAAKHMMAMNMPAAVEEVRKGIRYLQGQSDVTPKKVGVVGFCMGGLLTWKVAEQENGELAAIAPFYAGHYTPTKDDIRKVTAPVMAVWGEQDASIPVGQRNTIMQFLQEEGKTYKALVYPAGHAFMNPSHGALHEPSAQAAWSELLLWFKQYLG